MDLDELVERAHLVLRVPLVQHLGLELVDADDPGAGVRLQVGPEADNGGGSLHAAATTALLETAAYLALARELAPDEHAVSLAVTVTLIGAAGLGQRVEARGSVDRRTRRMGFVSVLAEADGRLIARASVVKSILAWPTSGRPGGSNARTPNG